MCACDFDLKFTFISCGWEGSASDVGVGWNDTLGMFNAEPQIWAKLIKVSTNQKVLLI